jgi:hypothetical protein
VATSKIERISADLDDFARALVGQRAGAAAREMADAVSAIGGLVDEATEHPMSLRALDDAQELLLATDPFEGEAAGAPRTTQNWLGGSDLSPRDAIYVPLPLLCSLTSCRISSPSRTAPICRRSRKQPSSMRSSSPSTHTPMGTVA